jgi:hypothetical protein
MNNETTIVTEKQRSGFGTYFAADVDAIVARVQAKYGMELLREELPEAGYGKFTTLYYLGRLGIDRYATIRAYIEGFIDGRRG